MPQVPQRARDALRTCNEQYDEIVMERVSRWPCDYVVRRGDDWDVSGSSRELQTVNSTKRVWSGNREDACWMQ